MRFLKRRLCRMSCNDQVLSTLWNRNHIRGARSRCERGDASFRSASTVHARVLALVLALALLTPGRLLTAQHIDVVRGTVVTDSGAAIPNADIVVTIAPSADAARGQSDTSGSFHVAIRDGSGEYVLTVASIGRRPFRLRLTRTGARDTTFTVRATLASAVTALRTVRIKARSRPSRSLDPEAGAGTSGMDKTFDGIIGSLPPDLAGNFDAMAASIPGLSVSAAGVSAFGVGNGGNATTLNGLGFGASGIPRDAKSVTRFVTSAWDPSIGGFAGFLNATTLARGGNISYRSGHISVDVPSMEIAAQSAGGRAPSLPYLSLSEGGNGAIVLDKYFYNFGLSASRRAGAPTALTGLGRQALNTVGVSADSVARLLSILNSLQFPHSTPDAGVAPVITSGSAVLRIDRAPSPISGPKPGATWSITGFGQYSRADGTSLTQLMLPSYAGRTSSADFAVQGVYSTYLGSQSAYINETSAALSLSDQKSSPDATFPGGSVFVTSDLANGGEGAEWLSFGGNGALASHSRNLSAEVINKTGFLVAGRPSLPLKVYLQSRLTSFTQDGGVNSLGSFAFPSLLALSQGTPARFSRTLGSVRSAGGEWIGAAAVGGDWLQRNLTVTGGLRLDANVFTTAPSENTDVVSRFGAHTNHIPNGLDISPRLGFTWRYTGAYGYSSTGTSLAVINRGGAQIRGGIGEFRSLLAPTLLADALAASQRTSGYRQLLCVGAAAPTPNWNVFEADPSVIPSECSGASALADTGTAVRLFDRSYTAMRSWRATLGWTSTVMGQYVALDGAYALNLHMPGTMDLNFSGIPRMVLPEEHGRPVYVDPTGVVESTGSLAIGSSRTYPEFGRVTDHVSDLRGNTRQLTAYVIPSLPPAFGLVTVGYTYLDARSQSRGFDQSTGGDPRLEQWAPNEWVSRHQIVVQAAREFNNFGVTAFVRAASGVPFTPIVASDINGDGLANDRAFIFDPATATDRGLASNLATMLAAAPGRVRSCIRRQIGHVVAPNSCEGPWSAALNSSVFVYPSLPWTADRASVALTVTNVLAAADRIVHGAGRMHGWGAAPLADPVLYEVKGFDPSVPAFRYEVNPKFGTQSTAVAGVGNPFRISIDVSINLGRSAAEQLLEQNLRVRPALTGTRAPADSIKARYMRSNFTDIYRVVLQLSDSLALSRAQMESAAVLSEVLRGRADSVYSQLADELAALPGNYDHEQVLRRVSQANDSVWQIIYAEKEPLRHLLTPGQIRLLPDALFSMLNTPGYHRRFFFQ